MFQGPPAPYGVVICYEGIFPDLFRSFVRDGARLMVNMTNDAWFGRTSGPEQHLGMYPFRAVEHRVPVVRAANTGVSAFIDPTGAIHEATSLDTATFTRARVERHSGGTFYVRFGEWVGVGSFAAAFVLLLARRRAGAAAARADAGYRAIRHH